MARGIRYCACTVDKSNSRRQTACIPSPNAMRLRTWIRCRRYDVMISQQTSPGPDRNGDKKQWKTMKTKKKRLLPASRRVQFARQTAYDNRMRNICECNGERHLNPRESYRSEINALRRPRSVWPTPVRRALVSRDGSQRHGREEGLIFTTCSLVKSRPPSWRAHIVAAAFRHVTVLRYNNG